MVKTLCSQCNGPQVPSLLRELDSAKSPHAATSAAAKKKKKKSSKDKYSLPLRFSNTKEINHSETGVLEFRRKCIPHLMCCSHLLPFFFSEIKASKGSATGGGHCIASQTAGPYNLEPMQVPDAEKTVSRASREPQ